MSEQNDTITVSTEANPAEGSSPLDRLANESPAAHEAFLYYVDMPLPRSLKKAAADLGGSENTFEEWSAKFQWRKRLQAYRAQLVQRRVRVETAVADQQEEAAKISQEWIQCSDQMLRQLVLKAGETFDSDDIVRIMRAADHLGCSARKPRRLPPAVGQHLDQAYRKDLRILAEYVEAHTQVQAAPAATQAAPPAPAPSATPNRGAAPEMQDKPGPSDAKN